MSLTDGLSAIGSLNTLLAFSSLFAISCVTCSSRLQQSRDLQSDSLLRPSVKATLSASPSGTASFGVPVHRHRHRRIPQLRPLLIICITDHLSGIFCYHSPADSSIHRDLSTWYL
ncbi:hypothetical protein L1887_11307 [Cichorium endivia]|nr:hypothetical protein L1887_11307 [Cichorium endivia]